MEACEKLVENGMADFQFIFTLNGEENNHIKNLYNKIKEKNLPISFIGGITREEVFNYYSESVLIFPSYIETYGLPMLEAKLHKGIILASDCLFSHEILDGYKNAYFFDPFKKEELSKLIFKIYSGKIIYQ